MLFLLCVLAENALAKSAANWSVQYEPAKVVNGSPVLFRVTAPKTASSLTGSWLGHEFEFSFDQDRKKWFALAGAGQDTKPGSYPLELHAKTSAEQTISCYKKIPIKQQKYPRVQLTVPGKYTAPSPEEQQLIAQDKKTKEEIFHTVSAERAWQGSFVPPSDAPISEIFGIQRVFNGTVQSTHQGLDFRVPSGTPVLAVNRGRILLARQLFFEGGFVVIDHGQGLLTLYLHMSEFSVKEGDVVKKGQKIGLSGGTGRATGPHLHLAVRWQGVYLNPETLLEMRLP